MLIHNVNHFTWNNCYVAARCSEAIYPPKDWEDLGLDPDGPIKEIASQLGMSCEVFDIKNHRAAILYNPSFYIVVYCGTNDTADLWTDMNYFQTMLPSTQAMVHAGVNEAYTELNAVMYPWLAKLVKTGNKFIICGHSLGAGIAVLSLVDVYQHLGCCYTFGGMRVGNAALFDYISTPIIRVVHGADVVVHLPFEEMLIGGYEYEHRQQKLIYFNSDGSCTMGDRPLWRSVKENFSGFIGDAKDKDVIPYFIEDHAISNYVGHLRRRVENIR